ncbi:MAG TPA: acyltransferase [Hyphomicrobiales bacterium]|nr:acyltransferase [Hyphomicrobiales bacterium]
MANRYAALDGLRGAAAMVVFGFHVPWTSHLLGVAPLRNGYLAVDLFFMLSGFVIAAAYQARLDSRSAAADFLKRRFFRVYPMHVVVLVALLVLEIARLVAQHAGVMAGRPAFSGDFSPQAFVIQLLFLQGSGLFANIGWNVPSWSVSAEAVAYVLFAIAGVAGLLRRPRLVILAGVAGFAIYLAIDLHSGRVGTIRHLASLRCAAGFAIGTMLYGLGDSRLHAVLAAAPPRALGAIQVALVALLLATLTIGTGRLSVLNIPVLAALLLTLQFDRGAVASFLCSRPLQALGRWSYSIYLIHLALMLQAATLLEHFGAPVGLDDFGGEQAQVPLLLGDALFVLAVAAVLALAAFTYRRIEAPAREWGRRPWRAAVPATAAAE